MEENVSKSLDRVRERLGRHNNRVSISLEL
jgi:hypothetical protein